MSVSTDSTVARLVDSRSCRSPSSGFTTASAPTTLVLSSLCRGRTMSRCDSFSGPAKWVREWCVFSTRRAASSTRCSVCELPGERTTGTAWALKTKTSTVGSRWSNDSRISFTSAACPSRSAFSMATWSAVASSRAACSVAVRRSCSSFWSWL
ncbi:hypothetical protein QEG98_41600 [Myxococcus sp. MxC21-1]|uniref:hypothetical protein n=1 Tax=Myxococcus sp. MxC21-1 TaxID=3041439 RepID=UPI00292D1836|nr:hypothetical protein [Myxococcus sp. MxC21-1]WNZ62229.1 hypothetical protein QEG98_41600 [Myxococcus sp. MxC21-1]